MYAPCLYGWGCRCHRVIVMNKDLKYVILGAGQLGLAIMDELVADGKTSIKLANRSANIGETLPESVEFVQVDAAEPDQVAGGNYHGLWPRDRHDGQDARGSP